MNIVLVTGGVRSGKSRYAEQRAREAGGDAVTYIATCNVQDSEMATRVQAHRERRPDSWESVERHTGIATAVGAAHNDTVLLECITLLVSNVLSGEGDNARTAALEEVDSLLAEANRRSGTLIAVTNEVGSGGIALTPLGRRFTDLLGECNQRIAAAATQVVWLVSGIPVMIKGAEEHLPA